MIPLQIKYMDLFDLHVLFDGKPLLFWIDCTVLPTLVISNYYLNRDKNMIYSLMNCAPIVAYIATDKIIYNKINIKK